MKKKTKQLQGKLNFVTAEQRQKAMVQLKASLGWRLLRTLIEEGELVQLKAELAALELDHKNHDYQTIDEFRLTKYKISKLEYQISSLTDLLAMPDVILAEYEEMVEINDDPYKTSEEIASENA